MGRSVSPDPRAHRMTLRFTAAELLAVKEAARAAGMSQSDWVRTRAMNRNAAAKVAAGRSTAKAPRAPTAALDPSIYHELRHQGVNLNQIAHRMNAKDLLPPPELYELLERIRRLITPAAPAAAETAASPPAVTDRSPPDGA